jgi:hypothetical protein
LQTYIKIFCCSSVLNIIIKFLRFVLQIKKHSEVKTPEGVFLFSPSTPSNSLVPEDEFARLNVSAAGAGESVIERRVGNVQRPPVEQLRPRNSASESDYVPMQPSSKKQQRDEALARKAQSESVLTKDDYSEGNYALMVAKPKAASVVTPVKTPVVTQVKTPSVVRTPVVATPTPPPPQQQQADGDYAFMEMTSSGQLAQATELKPVPTAFDIMQIIPPVGPSELESDYALMVPGDGRTSPVLLEPKKTASEVAAIDLSRSPNSRGKT